MSDQQLQDLMALAHAGDANAQLQVGEYLLEKKDYDTALPWFKMSSDSGNVQAGVRANALGYDFQIGQNGKEKDEQLAFKLYEVSTECGNTTGMNNYAWCFCNGVGTACDRDKAYQWWKKATDLGDAWAMAQLGWCYENGSGITADMTLAATYYFKSFFFGNYQQYKDKFISLNIEPNPQLLQKDEILWLANFYSATGFGGTKPTNVDAAFRWNKVAAIYGDTHAMINVSDYYINGWGTEVNKDKSLEYLKMADEKGNWSATEELISQYRGQLTHKKVEKDDEIALQYALKIINSIDNQRSRYENAYRAAYDICIKLQKYQQAATIWKEKAKRGYGKAIWGIEEIAEFYEEQQNIEEAIFFYQEILEQTDDQKDLYKRERAKAEERIRVLRG